MRKPAIYRSTIIRWKIPSDLLPWARRTGYSPVPSGPVNGPLPFKRCWAQPNSTGLIQSHGLETPWKNCLPGLTAVSTSYCRLHHRLRTLNHKAIMRADLVATAAYCPLPARRCKYRTYRRRVGAGAHGNDPARFQQLVIEPLDYRRHFSKNGAGNNDQIRLARRASYHFGTETGNVMTAGECSHHFYVAARKTKIKRPDRIGLSPGNHIFKPGEQEIAPQRFFIRLLPRFRGGIILCSGQMSNA